MFFHGSYDFLPVGTILTPKENYEEFWQNTDFYSILEKHRPTHMLSHAESVFLANNEQDVDNLGGGTEWLFTVVASERIERHDQSWATEISIAISDDKPEDEIKKFALNYWFGVPSKNPVWEYLTPSATIINVEEY